MINSACEQIYEKALECGFDDCGIIPIEDMEGYGEKLEERMNLVPESRPFYQRIAGIADIKKRFPWAKSFVICTTWLGKYKYPESLRGMYAKSWLISPESYRESDAYKKKLEFVKWIEKQGIRCEGGTKLGHGQAGGLRYAAMKAGLGIIRKNNFFYSEKGSYIELDGYVIDHEYILRQSREIRQCPEKCTLCQKSCPTKTLSAPYVMNPFRCLSYCTTFGKGIVPEGINESSFGKWLAGCDACQDCCPFNRHDWNIGENFPGLDELLELLQPENIIKASDDELIKRVCPKTVDHIYDPEILRVNAKRVLRNINRI